MNLVSIQALAHCFLLPLAQALRELTVPCRYYDFRIDSDDGSNLWVNGNLAIENGGAFAGYCSSFAMCLTNAIHIDIAVLDCRGSFSAA